MDDLVHDGQTRPVPPSKFDWKGSKIFSVCLRVYARTGVGKAHLPVQAALARATVSVPPLVVVCVRIARTAFSQKFQNTCLSLSPSASTQASDFGKLRSSLMPAFSAVRRVQAR